MPLACRSPINKQASNAVLPYKRNTLAPASRLIMAVASAGLYAAAPAALFLLDAPAELPVAWAPPAEPDDEELDAYAGKGHQDNVS